MTSYRSQLPILQADLTLHPPRTTQGTTAATAALNRAQTFAALVRDEGPDSIGAYLDGLTPNQHYALTTTLAALTNLDASIDQLLAWLAPQGETA